MFIYPENRLAILSESWYNTVSDSDKEVWTDANDPACCLHQ